MAFKSNRQLPSPLPKSLQSIYFKTQGRILIHLVPRLLVCGLPSGCLILFMSSGSSVFMCRELASEVVPWSLRMRGGYNLKWSLFPLFGMAVLSSSRFLL
jgi:hypothetical protein